MNRDDLLCFVCGHPRRSHKWAFTNPHGTTYAYRTCRKCQARRRRNPSYGVCRQFMAAPPER